MLHTKKGFQQSPIRDAPHTYLAGLVGPHEIIKDGVAVLLQDEVTLLRVTKEAAMEMLDYSGVAKMDEHLQNAYNAFGGRKSTTREMIGLAHHLVFDCHNHY
jgi:hypothetical protein